MKSIKRKLSLNKRTVQHLTKSNTLVMNGGNSVEGPCLTDYCYTIEPFACSGPGISAQSLCVGLTGKCCK